MFEKMIYDAKIFTFFHPDDNFITNLEREFHRVTKQLTSVSFKFDTYQWIDSIHCFRRGRIWHIIRAGIRCIYII